MPAVRKSLYQRLPEIYRIKDSEQIPAGQLEAWLNILDQTQTELHNNIESLYHDLFIETCHDWVIPYIADLLGTSHLKGDPWTLRADVARTIKHRRRKGTLGSIESLTYALSRWAVHTVELRDRILWNQHLNHQRPDRNGAPPLPLLIEENGYIGGAVQGGTVNLRDPALLGFYDTAFDPFAKVIDVKPVTQGALRLNFPNLAIFIWRLQDYSLHVIRPSLNRNERFKSLPEAVPAGDAEFIVGFDLHPLGEPMVLFNKHRYRADAEPPDLTSIDAVPGPMPTARLSADTPTGNPQAYVDLEFYAAPGDLPAQLTDDRVGLTLYLPDSLSGAGWTIRGANLCAWQDGLFPPLREYEIAIDPEHGRILFGVTNQLIEADVIANDLFVSPTYGFSGPSGAHPVTRGHIPGNKILLGFDGYEDENGVFHAAANGSGLQQALDDIHDRNDPLVIEIEDSRSYDLNLNAISGIGDELGLKVLRLSESLHIRAASGQRPVVRLSRPLAFRPHDVTDPGVADLDVTLEGLYLTWDKASVHFAADTALVERAALNRLRLEGCTLDPGSHQALDGTRQAPRYAFRLDNDFGFNLVGGEDFDQQPEIVLENSIAGPVAMDNAYHLSLVASIIDAAAGVGADTPDLVLHAASGDIETEWGPSLRVDGATCFGRSRVESATGGGGIWLHALQVHDDLQGCIKFSYFSGVGDKLPQHQGCVFGTAAALSFVSEVFGEAGYAQLRLRSDDKILEQGPGHDAMGAFGYLYNTHKWKNINIRYREFMPVGIKPVLVPVT